MKLLLDAPLFEYDIRGLLMAFFPWQKFVTEKEAEDPSGLSVSYEGPVELTAGGKDVEADLVCHLHFFDTDREIDAKSRVPLDMRNRKEAKVRLKQELYRLLVRVTGKQLPWGTLSGIRPTKIAMTMLEEGRPQEEIRHHMEGDLLCSHEKTELAMGIAQKERGLIRSVGGKEGYSIYVGIPFCPTTCLYCSFTSYPIRAYQNKVSDYLKAVEKELLFIRENFKGRPLSTVYFGGGTPTSISAEELDTLCRSIVDDFDLSSLKEWTIEAGRPDSITEEKLKVMRKYPVTRISINPQTMHQKTLDLIGRFHTVDQVKEVFHLARQQGFDNINMDLILGLPGETREDVETTMEEIRALDPDSVTLHSLAIKRTSRLNLQKDKYQSYLMENSEEIMDHCMKVLKEMGQEPYYLYRQKNMAGNLENVGFSRRGKEGIYNILIMEEVQTIMACGAGTVSKRVFPDGRIERCDNVKEVDIYLARIDEMIERKKALLEL